MRVKKTTRVKKAARVKRTKKAAFSIAAIPTNSTWAVALVVMVVATAAIMMAARRPSHPADITSADMPPASIVTTDDAAKMRPASNTAAEASTAPAATETTETTIPVTITGCLERDQESFRLKDTSGADAPKARSWKSGFLRKSAAPIHVIDASNAVRLPNHVGQRVVVRGTLVDREMHVRSLQRVGDSCSKA
jgi:hypothetical protein